jgi:hypothetical protein
MRDRLIGIVAGLVIGTAIGAKAQVNIDRSRMAAARARAKTLALELKNEPANSSNAERAELLYTLAYVVLGEE